MEEEIWREIPKYDGFYEVSTLGNVRSMTRRINVGRGVRLVISKVLKQADTKDGYKCIVLKTKSHEMFNIRVHRLVCLAFLDNPELKPNINHKNGVKSDNRLDNLEWCTQSENVRHSYEMGFQKIKSGFTHDQAKLNPKEVDSIRRLLGVMPQHKIADMYMVSQQLVSRIKCNLAYKI